MLKASVTSYHIALMDVHPRTKFSILSSPSASISCPLFIWQCQFHIRWMHSLSGRDPFNLAVSMLKTWNGLHHTKAPAGCMVAMRWHAFCSELVHSWSCTYPVCICCCPVDLIGSQTTTWHATGQPEMFQTLTACSAADYWQGTHANWQITGVKWWSMEPNW